MCQAARSGQTICDVSPLDTRRPILSSSVLCRDPQSLHRVARFLSHHHGLVTQILSGVDHTSSQLLVLYMSLAHASALLQPDSAIEVQDTPAISAARSELMAFNTIVEARQRAAKATILDVRISAARSASWNRDVASCTVKAAVSQVRATHTFLSNMHVTSK